MGMQVKKSPHPLLWVTGIAVILFSATGIAAIMGWIPGSFGTPSNTAALEVSTSTAKHPTQKAHTAPIQMGANNSSEGKCSECGVIELVREIVHNGEGTGLGAAGGAVVGGVIGNQVGNGRGNDVATVVGAVGGAVAGNMIESRMKTTTSYEVTVRLEDGSRRVISATSVPMWRLGDRVKVINGEIRPNA